MADNLNPGELFSGVTPAPELREYAELTHVARRNFLLGMAGTAGAFMLDQLAGEYVWGGTNPKIEVASDRTKHVFPHTASLILPGFNVFRPDLIARSLMPTLDNYGQVWDARYAENGLQIDDLARTTAKTCKQTGVHTLQLYGMSMGGMVAVELGAILKSRHNINIAAIILDCSPQSHRDVKGTVQRLGVAALSETERLRLHGGPVTRTVLETGMRMANQHENAHEALVRVLRKSHDGELSNRLVQDQANMIHGFQAEKHLAILSNTVFGHLGPENPYMDRVVDELRAVPAWKRCLDDKIICAVSPVTGHANPVQQPRAYNQMLASVLRTSGLPDVQAALYERHRAE